HEPAAIGRRDRALDGRRDHKGRGGPRRVDRATRLVEELDAVAREELAGALDRVVKVGDNLDPVVEDAEDTVVAVVAERDRAAAGQRGAVGDALFGGVAAGTF